MHRTHEAAANLTAFGSSEFAKVVLGGLWGTPPALDLDAEAEPAQPAGGARRAQAASSPRATSPTAASPSLWRRLRFAKGIGATVEQDPSLLAHPLFGLFAEPASTVLVTAAPHNVSTIEKLAGQYNFFAARIGATGGSRSKSPSTAKPSSPLRSTIFANLWASALEANLHGEVTA